MKRILFVRRTYGFGGVEVILLDWLKRIDYSRYEVAVSSPADVFSALIAENNLPAKYIHLSPEQTTQIYGRYEPEKSIDELINGGFWRFFLRWLRFLRNIRPDIVIFMDGGFFSIPIACVLAAFIVTRRNVSATIHSPYKLDRVPQGPSGSRFGVLGPIRLWYRNVWRPRLPWRARGYLYRRVLTANRWILDQIVDKYGYLRAKIAILDHGVDTALFQPSQAAKTEFRKRWGIPETAFLVASTSRLSPEKNVDQLVRAFDELASKSPDLWLLLAGNGPLRLEVESLAAKCQARKRIILLGHVENVHSILQSADVYVLASTFEGCPIALLEAMAAGLTCLMSNIPAAREVLDNGRDGFLIEQSIEGILAGLEGALALSVSERIAMGRSARAKVIERFELDRAITSDFAQLGIGRSRSQDQTFMRLKGAEHIDEGIASELGNLDFDFGQETSTPINASKQGRSSA